MLLIFCYLLNLELTRKLIKTEQNHNESERIVTITEMSLSATGLNDSSFLRNVFNAL